MQTQKKYSLLGYKLPYRIFAAFFGDRKTFGCKTQADDPEWQQWLGYYDSFYTQTQKQGIGKIVNDAGYTVLKNIDLEGKKCLEFGPGQLPHTRFWQGRPSQYDVADIKIPFIKESQAVLRRIDIPSEGFHIDGPSCRALDEAYDIVLSFYNLEHLYPLRDYLGEIHRMLKPNGLFVGAIPCEGGLAWGLGRFLTTRRHMRNKFGVNPDKIICWEHPNFADEILTECNQMFECVNLDFWPLVLSSIDLNLLVKFVFQKR